MNDADSLAADFETHRTRLVGVADRILGDRAGAEDATQECWLRLQHTDETAIDNMAGWLTTTTARICLDVLRRRSRVDLDAHDVDRPSAFAAAAPDGGDPAAASEVAHAVGEALAILLDTLQPAERVAFVLHDTFGISFEDIGTVLERSPNAAKQLATRARTKIRGVDSAEAMPSTPAEHARAVQAFLLAARGGDLATLVGVLHPDIILRADHAAIAMGAPGLVRGADGVAAVFYGRAQMAVAGWIDSVAGMMWQVGGGTKVAWEFTIVDGVICRIDMIADADTLDAATITTVEHQAGGRPNSG